MNSPVDLNLLEAAARAAGGEQWTNDAVGEDGRRDVIWGADGDGVAIAYHCIGHMPESLSAEDIAAHIAAANPAVLLALVERLRAAEASCKQALVAAQTGEVAADIYTALLWLYRRLPHGYANPPHIDRAVKYAAVAADADPTGILADRAALAQRIAIRALDAAQHGKNGGAA